MKTRCCEQMERHLEMQDVAIVYVSVFREYGIKILDGGSSFQIIYYCPWCGCKLPPSLRDKWFETLENEFDEFDGFADPRIPSEFKSDEWWQKQNF